MSTHTPQIIRRRVNFFGHVQGVGFRATARGIASNFAVTGWVRNEADRSVMMEVQGAASEVASFLSALREEMGRNISREAATDLSAAHDERGFEIRR